MTRVVLPLGVSLMTAPALLAEAKREWLEKRDGKPYVCPSRPR